MDQAQDFVGAWLIVPALVSAIVAYLSRLILPSSVARRSGLAIALASSFVAGYACLPEWAEWIPARHWHWLPTIAVVSATIGSLGFARGVWIGERWLLSFFFAIATACLIVPDWESLAAVRGQYIVVVSLYLLALAGAMPPLAERCSSPVWLILLTVVAGSLATVVFATVSIRFGQLTGLLVSGMLGTAVASYWYRKEHSHGSVSFVFALLTGSLAFVAAIDPDPALWLLLVLPAVPIVLWGTAYLPIDRSQQKAVVIDVAAVIGLLAALSAWIVLAH